VIFEDQATKHCQEGKPYPFASALKVRCLCGNLIHPIPGAWCTQCGLKVLEVRTDFRRTLEAQTENWLLDPKMCIGWSI
jgi:hypothetical protein